MADRIGLHAMNAWLTGTTSGNSAEITRNGPKWDVDYKLAAEKPLQQAPGTRQQAAGRRQHGKIV